MIAFSRMDHHDSDLINAMAPCIARVCDGHDPKLFKLDPRLMFPYTCCDGTELPADAFEIRSMSIVTNAFNKLKAEGDSVERCYGSMADYVLRSVTRGPEILREKGDDANFVANLAWAAARCKNIRPLLKPWTEDMDGLRAGAPSHILRKLDDALSALHAAENTSGKDQGGGGSDIKKLHWTESSKSSRKDTATAVSPEAHRVRHQDTDMNKQNWREGNDSLENEASGAGPTEAFDWQRIESRSKPGKFYWYNRKTGESKYELPLVVAEAQSSVAEKLNLSETNELLEHNQSDIAEDTLPKDESEGGKKQHLSESSKQLEKAELNLGEDALHQTQSEDTEKQHQSEISEWLQEVAIDRDQSGVGVDLSMYEAAFSKKFSSLEELITAYKTNDGGYNEVQVFKDGSIEKMRHKLRFRRWFQSMRFKLLVRRLGRQ
eukprot:gnl/MRDRNA2_/MRDRNA2_18445_c0_seq1.p1 gnl/MRDRNA2_/MRDRNA2_18445_c0~~gnl/MRDRNA2_/MRDRNA2_18445_c0_seq1.p1  ORF type:complete len:434 (-),score=97.67 gnl/MRDRNA2_/MRDRNA2_18445_c0_seq1:60-1361(-)